MSLRGGFSVGTAVEVRDRFRGYWSRGFEIAEATSDGYWIVRLSDRYTLPTRIARDDVRRAS